MDLSPWVLVIAMSMGYGGGIDHVPMPSEAVCMREGAKVVAKSGSWTGPGFMTVCLDRREPVNTK